MARHNNPGIAALSKVSRIEGAPSVENLGYALGPRINAGSRINKADMGAHILTLDDPEQVEGLALKLDGCNEKRKDIQNEMLREAVRRVEAEKLDQNPVIIVGDESWHPGLSGLVAGNLKEKYGKPSIVVTYAQAERGRLEGRGSGRSVPGVNMAAVFLDARNEGLLVKGGGHAMAGGFTILPDQLEAFSAFAATHIARQMKGQSATVHTLIDSVLSVRALSPDFVKVVYDSLSPFGQGNPEPFVCIAACPAF